VAKLSTLLDQIDSGTLLLPEFQRGYVWNRDQVRGLMRSLYLGYPVGSLLTWETDAGATDTRGSAVTNGVQNLLLDGQQRLTSLYGVARGTPPTFFEGDAKAFTGLYFNADTGEFEFYAPVKMRDDIAWVDVTSVLRDDFGPLMSKFFGADPSTAEQRVTNLNRLRTILDREFYLDKITGADKTTDVVVDIFNRVNSGGTKLSKGDLALAKVSAQSADARDEMRAAIARWKAAGYTFKLDWLLRSVTVAATGRVQFSYLDSVSISDFTTSLAKSRDAIGRLLDLIAARLGLDSGGVLLGSYGFPVLVRYLIGNAGKFASIQDENKALYWLVQSGVWGRYAGSSETVLTQDLDALQKNGLDGLIDQLAHSRGGSLRITGRDFNGYGSGARFYPLLYMLTRVKGARDLVTGLTLREQMLGRSTSLQVHHIFPKAQLYATDPPTSQSDVNALANFALLTQASNLEITKRQPQEYLSVYEAAHPGVLASQWIPTEPDLWAIPKYLDFLQARRELLAAAANEFLDSLLAGSAPQAEPLERTGGPVAGPSDVSDDPLVAGLARLRELGLAEPERDVEVSDPATGETIGIAEALWRDGLQPGRGLPVIVDIDGTPITRARFEALGYHHFETVDALVQYAEREAEEDAG
jgi:hypothetical protein